MRPAQLPRIAALAFAVTGLAACSDAPPPIGRDLPRALAAARPVFNDRVARRFPVGSDEAALLSELRRESFTIAETRQQRAGLQSGFQSLATYEARGFPCRLDWTISWNAANGKVAAIAGGYEVACL